MAITHLPPSGTVNATLNFYSPPTDGSTPFNHVDTPPAGLPQRNFNDAPHIIPIHDARSSPSDFTLDRDAFQILTSLPPSPTPTDFTSDASIRSTYYPEIEALLLQHIPGSTKILIFDHTLRQTDPSSPRRPVQRVHIDQTPASALARVRRHLPPDEADKLLQGRYRIVNVWRPLNQRPVESFPLAFASSNTLEEGDVVPVEHRYAGGYKGETAGIQYNEGQRWYYLSGMTRDERVLLQCFDSETGTRVAHSAFDDPRTREGAEGRESVEVRALVFGP